MHNPPRLVLAFAAAAHQAGALIANHVEAERLIVRDGQVHGVAARDVLSGDRFDIRARVVINAAGPWAEGLLEGVSPLAARTPGTYSRDACFVINRRPTAPYALALQGATRDADAVLGRSARHMFLVPWRDRTLVGVWHSVVPRDPDAVGHVSRRAQRLHRGDQRVLSGIQPARVRSGARGLWPRAIRREGAPGGIPPELRQAVAAHRSPRGRWHIRARYLDQRAVHRGPTGCACAPWTAPLASSSKLAMAGEIRLHSSRPAARSTTSRPSRAKRERNRPLLAARPPLPNRCSRISALMRIA